MNKKNTKVKLRRLDQLIEALKKANFGFSAKETVNQLKLKIATLLKELSSKVASSELKRRIASFAIIAGSASMSQAQQFLPEVTNGFGFTSFSTYLTVPSSDLVDLDNDGDFDLIVEEQFHLEYYENVGTVTAPSFAAPVMNPFGITQPVSTYLNRLDLADMDDDGDIDLMVLDYDIYTYATIPTYYENVGTASAPSFAAPVVDAFGLVVTSDGFIRMADIDTDGDFDLIVSNFYGVYLYENVGTSTSPSFSAGVTNPFGIALPPPPQGYFVNKPIDIVDFDSDGDLDIFAGGDFTGIIYLENIGTPTAPNFAPFVSAPFGIDAVASEQENPNLVDIDNDGDFDMMNIQTSGYSVELIFHEFDTPSNVSILEKENDIVIGPNPVVDVLDIHSDVQFESLTIYDAAGRVVETIASPEKSISLSTLNTGIYNLVFTDQQGSTYRQKINKL